VGVGRFVTVADKCEFQVLEAVPALGLEAVVEAAVGMARRDMGR